MLIMKYVDLRFVRFSRDCLRLQDVLHLFQDTFVTASALYLRINCLPIVYFCHVIFDRCAKSKDWLALISVNFQRDFLEFLI